MTQALVPMNNTNTQQYLEVPTTLGEVKAYAIIMAESERFEDARQVAQAAVKIIAGAEMGIKPFAAMCGIHIIKGKPCIGASLMGMLIQSHPDFSYRVIELTDQICSIDYYQKGEKIGNSTFTKKDAETAGTQNMQKFARNMLYARAMSNGARWYCPVVFGGPVYNPEEMGAKVNGEGDAVIDTTFEPDPTRTQKAAPVETQATKAKPSPAPTWKNTLRARYQASKAASSVKWSPELIGRVLHLDETNANDCFSGTTFKPAGLSEHELIRCIHYLDNQGDILPAGDLSAEILSRYPMEVMACQP